MEVSAANRRNGPDDWTAYLTAKPLTKLGADAKNMGHEQHRQLDLLLQLLEQARY
jgi:hypothetical protein